ncbi:hypothetical protein QF036_005019 [Arthrobacter globiformis]|nr:hypothetical protein [Arthrobacter globiformis]
MTHHMSAMLNSHPQGVDAAGTESLAESIAACFECSQACTACADACLGEKMVADLAACIRTDLDCADICAATGNILTRQTATNTAITQPVLEACRAACGAWAMNASSTPACTSTAGSAPKPAAAAKPPALHSSAPRPDHPHRTARWRLRSRFQALNFPLLRLRRRAADRSW